MNTPNHDELVQLAADWLRQRTVLPDVAGMDITGQTHLFENGVLDSLGLVDLVAFLEEQSGNQVDLMELDEVEIATLDGLCRAALATR